MPDALQPATPAEAPAPVPADAGPEGAQGAPPAPPASGAAESPSDSLLPDQSFFSPEVERLRQHFQIAWYASEPFREIAWFGLPIHKIPFDLFQYQEIISQQRPEFVIECGAYLGGSTLYFAHLLDLVGHGTVISIDLANCWEPQALAHPRVRALAGSSVDPQILSRVRQLVPPGASCFVILDSDHQAEHVLAELRAYQEFVQVGNYLVVEDTVLNGHPLPTSGCDSCGPGPFEAVEAFLKEDAHFVPDRWREQKLFMTCAPSGWLRRVAEPIAGRWLRTPRGESGAPMPDALQPATPAEAPAPVPADAGPEGAQGAPPAPPAPGATEPPSDSLERLGEHFHTAWFEYLAWKEIAWFGLPIRKNPFDVFQYQEIISQQRPEFVIECGAYLGGSTLYFAHLLDLVGHGTVISIDLANCWEPRVLAHPRVRALAGSSVDPQILSRVRQLVPPGASCLVVLDSDHRAEHVLAELRAYQEFVQVGNYLVVEGTNLNGHPVLPGWGPGPFEAVEAFLKEDAPFVPDRWREQKLFMTFAPSGWLRRVP